MKTRTFALIISAIIAFYTSCATTGLGLSHSNVYSDAYYTREDAAKEAAAAKAHNEALREAQVAAERQRQADAAAAKSESPDTQTPPAAQSRTLGPEDFATYQEYREYLDNASRQGSGNTAPQQGNGTQASQKGTATNPHAMPNQGAATQVTNNYYYTQPAPSSVVYTSYWDSPSYAWTVTFDPWYCTTYRVRYASWPHHTHVYYYDRPYWTYPYPPYSYAWHYPYGSWSYDHGYYDGFHDGFYSGYYAGGGYHRSQHTIINQREIFVGRRPQSTAMSNYGRIQRSPQGQVQSSAEYPSVRSQGNHGYTTRTTTRYSGSNDRSAATRTGGSYTPSYTSPDQGNTRRYNDGVRTSVTPTRTSTRTEVYTQTPSAPSNYTPSPTTRTSTSTRSSYSPSSQSASPSSSPSSSATRSSDNSSPTRTSSTRRR